MYYSGGVKYGKYTHPHTCLHFIKDLRYFKQRQIQCYDNFFNLSLYLSFLLSQRIIVFLRAYNRSECAFENFITFGM